MIPQIVAALASFGVEWFKNKKEESQTKHQVKLERIKAEKDWDTTQAQNSNSSWKDEWFTVLLSIPLVLAFFPDYVYYIEEGFRVLEGMPEYYKAFLGAAIAASFGIKAVANWKK